MSLSPDIFRRGIYLCLTHRARSVGKMPTAVVTSCSDGSWAEEGNEQREKRALEHQRSTRLATSDERRPRLTWLCHFYPATARTS
ncbi:hypothetical protein NDU88_007704 [Pleurodeles waltl]|uniref:Secreted protein n=1 Tax=Pleurodeles waltl TaxID=8319 RepID=A0AAV7NVM7_PLEWA|nr:hypothetical protein NDU88_007704 [Pleurodeles waltl]